MSITAAQTKAAVIAMVDVMEAAAELQDLISQINTLANNGWLIPSPIPGIATTTTYSVADQALFQTAYSTAYAKVVSKFGILPQGQ